MILPDFYFEKKLWKKGFKVVAGLDEVGRGSFVGPVVTAAVVFAPNFKFPSYVNASEGKQFPISNEKGERVFIDDSKKLTKLQRDKADRWIRKNALAYGIGLGTVNEINSKGMTKATSSGFRRAITAANKELVNKINYLLIDAFYIPYIRGIPSVRKSYRKRRKDGNIYDIKAKQLAIIHGDERSFSIAAASIIAKVYRDKLMIKISKTPRYQVYKWDENKGYGTRQHREAIKNYGVTKLHRKKFIHF